MTIDIALDVCPSGAEKSTGSCGPDAAMALWLLADQLSQLLQRSRVRNVFRC